METAQDNDHSGNGTGHNGRDVVGYGEVTSHFIGEIGGGDGSVGFSEISFGDIEGTGDRDDINCNEPMGLEPQCPLANRTRGRIEDSRGVAPFLIKLYSMVDDKATNSIISWGSSCTTFIISDERLFISKIIPCYFKSGSFDNFISQLKNYGFKKKEWNQLEFEHEHFQEGKLHKLKTIKRKNRQSNIITKPCDPTIELSATFSKIRREQKQINDKTQRFKYEIIQTLFEIQTITKAMINKFIFTFSEAFGKNRTVHDIDLGIHFVDIIKDFQPISDQIKGLGSDVDCLTTLTDFAEKVIPGFGSEGGRSGVGDGCCIPKFLHKLYNMVTNEDIDDLISWNHPNCDSFIIWDIDRFATHVIPMYFKHTNFKSFSSQLNIYGFKKVSQERHEYANLWFRGGRYDLLANIKRRSEHLKLTRIRNVQQSDIEMLNSRLKPIQQDQENKIIWLSNYEDQMKSSVYEFKNTVVNMAYLIENTTQKGNEKGQKPKVNELETASKEASNQEEPSYLEELGIDPEVLEKIIREDPWFD